MYESFTEITGKRSMPSFAIALRRMTPVVVSSVLPMTFARSDFRSSALSPSTHLRTGGCQVIEAAERDHVDRTHDVGAVVHRDVGPVRDRGADVLVVGVRILALDREDLDAVVRHEVRRDVILRGERVRGAQRDVGAARLERHHEVRGLGGHVQARAHLEPGERLLLREARLHLAEHLHRALGPFGAVASLGGEAQVLHVVRGGGRRLERG